MINFLKDYNKFPVFIVKLIYVELIKSYMGHHHHNNEGISGRNLFITIVLNFVITIGQVIGGILSNSLALLSDALHNFSDGLAIVLAYIANRIGKRNSTAKRTFGYKRIEILVALFNSVVLVVISIYLFYEAYKLFIHPQEIDGTLMLWVAILGLIANLIAVFLLQRDSKHSLNVKAAYLHLIGDTLSSVAVIAGSIFIIVYDIYWIDPLLTFIIGIYILKETYSILKETIDILMQSAPKNIDLDKIRTEVENIDCVRNIHHVHVWRLSENEVHFECHVELKKNLKVSETDDLIIDIEKHLSENHNINHVTVQFEFLPDHDKNFIHQKHSK